MALVKTDHVIPPELSVSHLWILDSLVDRDEVKDCNHLQTSLSKWINYVFQFVFKYVA